METKKRNLKNHAQETVKTRSSSSFLGKGITKQKVLVVILTLAISLGSVMMLWQWESDDDGPNVGPVFPISKETIEQQEYVLSLINKERAKEELPELTLNNNSIAQRYAEELLRTDNVKMRAPIWVRTSWSMRARTLTLLRCWMP